MNDVIKLVESRLAKEGLLVDPPADDDLPPPDEVAELERKHEAWLRTRDTPLGLTEAVLEDRR